MSDITALCQAINCLQITLSVLPANDPQRPAAHARLTEARLALHRALTR